MKVTEPKAAKPSKKKKRVVFARTNKKQTLVDLGLKGSYGFLSRTEATIQRMYALTPLGKEKYEVENREAACSAILKLVLKTDQTNPMTFDWSVILWDISQRANVLPPDVFVTFTKRFERVDDKVAEKGVKRRMNLAILSSENKKNKRKQNAYVRHDAGLVAAIESGDCVVAFGAEAIVTASTELKLEEALKAIQNYLKANDETRGLAYELDINRQMQPFLLYGPNAAAKNKDVFYNMTSADAAVTAMFVDAGGDRLPGSEYLGVSVGKMISSHAAYKLQNSRAFFVGNDTKEGTQTLLGDRAPAWVKQMPSQIYLSLAASRSYLLSGHTVTHFVLDHVEQVPKLYEMPVSEPKKQMLDVAKGYLNMLEIVDHSDFSAHPERIAGRFNTHLNNIILLLGQYRDGVTSVNDDFASVTRSILTDFFVANKYYAYNPLEHLEDIRLIGRHDQYKTLADLGAWIAQRRKSNTDSRMASPLAELYRIINENILPTIPALNQKTKPEIDNLLRASYRVIDVTGMNVGSMFKSGDATTNVMMISYLNLILPSLSNGDALFFHGFSRVSGIAKIIQDMVSDCGRRVDVCFTESNQNAAMTAYETFVDTPSFVCVDLYGNDITKLKAPLGIDPAYSESLSDTPGAFFLRTRQSADYIYLDHIL